MDFPNTLYKINRVCSNLILRHEDLFIFNYTTACVRLAWTCVHRGSFNGSKRFDEQGDTGQCCYAQGLHGYSSASFPVIFLLHGAGDNDWTWLNATSVASLADQYGIILVCPSAELSWYLDSPEIPGSMYETFMTKELLDYVDGHYRTRPDRLHRTLIGCSMGGHGALFLAIRHKDLFATAVSLSGGVDFRPFPDYWNLSAILGSEKRSC
jgi:pimeloyl-ACP methyl ester carboxylesterase